MKLATSFALNDNGLVNVAHNLPWQLTGLVGRAEEISNVERLLGEASLLTLTGPGGVGKTRLALEVCRSLVAGDRRSFPDGVWLVELAPTVDPALVPDTVATALQIPEVQDEPAVETLSRALKAKQLLVMLDNCEHVICASAMLAEQVLRQCPSVTILATSREPLNIAGEVTWSVPSLLADDGAALFALRATEARPGFAVSAQQEATVAELCQRLDGLPLAIELAAASVRSLTVEEIAARLSERFSVLAAGRRTAPRRQQSLRAMVDWSYTRLSPEEQMLFARLSAFAGGWTLEAAEGVCADPASVDGGDIQAGSVLGLMHELVQKSLVIAEQHGADTRYRLLETLRQYAGEKLRELGQEADLRTRHLQWFTDMAEKAEAGLAGPDQMARDTRFNNELPNIRVALSWAGIDNNPEPGLRLAAALGPWWWNQGHSIESCDWLEGLLSQAGALKGARATFVNARTKALNALAFQRQRQGQPATTRRHAQAALMLARKSSDRAEEAHALLLLGQADIQEGRAAAGETRLKLVLELARELGDERLSYRTLQHLGWAAELQDRPDRALELCTEALARSEELGDPHARGSILRSIASAATDLGRLDLARQRLAEALACSPTTTQAAPMLAKAAGLAAAEGKARRALRLAGAALGLRQLVHARLQHTDEITLDRQLAPARQALSTEDTDAAFAEGAVMDLDQAIGYALENLVPDEKREPAPTASVLSRRETEIAQLLGQGLSNAEIADRLVISHGTAKRHVENILAKLGLRSRMQVAGWLAQQDELERRAT